MTTEITLPEAANRLRLSWHATYKLALQGEFGEMRRIASRWLIDEAGVAAYRARAREAVPVSQP
jgi:hypothetical protein